MNQTPADRVAENVRAAMARRDVRGPAVARALGLSQSAFSRRYRGYTEFRATELQILSELLNLPVEDFYPSPEPASA